jgi:hypothetical protein
MSWQRPAPTFPSFVIVTCATFLAAGLPIHVSAGGWAAASSLDTATAPRSITDLRLPLSEHPRPDAAPTTLCAHSQRCSSSDAPVSVGVPLTTAWRNITTTVGAAPLPRYEIESQMTYDPVDGYVLLFGGYSVYADGGISDDTWTFQNDAWQRIFPTHSPPATAGGSLVWDTADGYALLFGGDNGSGRSNQSWTFVSGTWTELYPSVSPPAGVGESMVWDPPVGAVLLFGGTSQNDTWEFRAGNWTEVVSSQVCGRVDGAPNSG